MNFLNVLVYGGKSAWPLFQWIDDIRQADVVDLGCMLTMGPPGIHLARKGPGVDVRGFQVSMWPMLTTAQRDVGCNWFASLQMQSPDPHHPINGIVAVKIHPSLTHVVKGLATANFTTVPAIPFMQTRHLAAKRSTSSRENTGAGSEFGTNVSVRRSTTGDLQVHSEPVLLDNVSQVAETASPFSPEHQSALTDLAYPSMPHLSSEEVEQELQAIEETTVKERDSA